MRSFLRTIRAYLADQDPTAPRVSPAASPLPEKRVQGSAPGVTATLRSYVADQELGAEPVRPPAPGSGAWNSIRAYLADEEPSRT